MRWLALVVLVPLPFGPLIYIWTWHWMHPHYTSMQVVQTMWPLYLTAALAACVLGVVVTWLDCE